MNGTFRVWVLSTAFLLALFMFCVNARAAVHDSVLSHHFLYKPVVLDPNDSTKKEFYTTIEFFSHSTMKSVPTLIVDYEVSSLNHSLTGVTVLVDDIPVYTIPASPADTGGNLERKAVIPLRHLETGKRIHSLQFVAGTGKKRNVCEKKGENEWIVIQPSSRIEITYEDRANVEPTLTNFPWSLRQPHASPIVLVYPDKHTKEDDTFLIQTISFLAKKLSLSPGDLHIVQENEFWEKPYGEAVLFVGLLPHFQEETIKQFSHVKKDLQQGEASLVVTRSFIRPQQYFYMLAAGGYDGVVNANKQLNRNAFLNALKGNETFMDTQLLKNTSPQDQIVKTSVPISEIGYPDGLYAKNVQEQTTLSFRLRLQPGMVLEEGSRVVIYYSYNDTFDEKRSTLTASINGIPVETVLLAKGGGEKSSVSLKIPSTEWTKESITVDLTFSFKEGKETCDGIARKDGWAKILPNTHFELSIEKRAETNFNHFPYPLVKNFAWNNLQFVLPVEARSFHYEQVANMIVKLAKFITHDDTGLSLVRENEVTDDDLKGKNHIFYDVSFANNERMRAIEKTFPIAPNSIRSKWELRGQNQFHLMDTLTNKNAVIMQMVKSPFQSSKFFLAIHATNPLLMEQSYELVDSESWREEIISLLRKMKITTKRTFPINVLMYTDRKERIGESIVASNQKQPSLMTQAKQVTTSLFHMDVLRIFLQSLLFIVTVILFMMIWSGRKRRD
ncbi:hypothetical protein GGR02_001563 [Anoxybacillus voinovskiensis]|uniref:Cellulose synthase n=1 Tax=Anoxybacteroides voinovskiense TaxID=230470 RepID=A0A840DKJ4_9BACL|nr:cellulose biosynthesis cyclic di-GMP-binding regulatory protein BcsB [Anoxybacillus voinovskiensis]MBB4073801.1 hypothetical protein [Anoxybacillus voinovskiensis]GGJ63793.1 hypothetical protein GCM10008982_11290 [Anoxybacillus voinovskiensis]